MKPFITFTVVFFCSISFANTNINIRVESDSGYPNYPKGTQLEILHNWMLHILERTNDDNISTLFADPVKERMFLETVKKMRARVPEIPFIIRSLEFTDGGGISPSQYLGYAGEDDPLDPRNVNFTIKFIQMIALYNSLSEFYNAPEKKPELDGLRAFLESVTMHEFLHGYDMYIEPLENIRRQSRHIVDGVMTKEGIVSQAVRIFDVLEPRGFTIGSAVLDGYRGTDTDYDRDLPRLGNLMKASELIKSYMIRFPEKFAPGGEFYLLRLADFEVKKLREERSSEFEGEQGQALYQQLLNSSAGLLNPFLNHYLIWDATTAYNGEEFTGMLGIMFWGQVRPLIIIQDLISLNNRLEGLTVISRSEIDYTKSQIRSLSSEWSKYMENDEIIDEATKLTISKALFKSNGYLNDPSLGIQSRYQSELEKAMLALEIFNASGVRVKPSAVLQTVIMTAVEEAEALYSNCVNEILNSMLPILQAENYCQKHLDNVSFMDAEAIVQKVRVSLELQSAQSCTGVLVN